jgi:hypothetical protein
MRPNPKTPHLASIRPSPFHNSKFTIHNFPPLCVGTNLIILLEIPKVAPPNSIILLEFHAFLHPPPPLCRKNPIPFGTLIVNRSGQIAESSGGRPWGVLGRGIGPETRGIGGQRDISAQQKTPRLSFHAGVLDIISTLFLRSPQLTRPLLFNLARYLRGARPAA